MEHSLHDILDHYEAELRAFQIWMKDTGMTPATQREYTIDIRKFTRFIYPKPITAVDKLDVMSFLAEVREQGVGDAARNRYLSSLRTFFNGLQEVGHLQGNPAALVKKSKQEKNRIPTYLEEDELEAFIQSISGRYQFRNIAICLLMGYVGLRVGEVHRVNLADLETDGIKIQGKGRKWRLMPLHPSIQAVIQAYIENERIVPKKEKEQALFISQLGRRLSIRMIQTLTAATFQSLQREFPRLANKKLSSHKLRHTFATNQIRGGTPIRTLQEILGHASIETTQIYTHVSNKEIQLAMHNVKIPKIAMPQDT